MSSHGLRLHRSEVLIHSEFLGRLLTVNRRSEAQLFASDSRTIGFILSYAKRPPSLCKGDDVRFRYPVVKVYCCRVLQESHVNSV